MLGRDKGFPVCDDYAVPFAWNGTLHEVVVEVPGPTRPDPKDELRERCTGIDAHRSHHGLRRRPYTHRSRSTSGRGRPMCARSTRSTSSSPSCRA